MLMLMDGREDAVGRHLAAHLGAQVVHPGAAHLPAAIHVGIHLGEKVLGLLQKALWQFDDAHLVVDEHIQFHVSLLGFDAPIQPRHGVCLYRQAARE